MTMIRYKIMGRTNINRDYSFHCRKQSIIILLNEKFGLKHRLQPGKTGD